MPPSRAEDAQSSIQQSQGESQALQRQGVPGEVAALRERLVSEQRERQRLENALRQSDVDISTLRSDLQTEHTVREQLQKSLLQQQAQASVPRSTPEAERPELQRLAKAVSEAQADAANLRSSVQAERSERLRLEQDLTKSKGETTRLRNLVDELSLKLDRMPPAGAQAASSSLPATRLFVETPRKVSYEMRNILIPSPIVSTGSVTFLDTFETETGNWPSDRWDWGSATLSQGRYTVEVVTREFGRLFGLPPSASRGVSDLSVEVSASIVKAPSQEGWGIVLESGGGDRVHFDITLAGRFTVYRCRADCINVHPPSSALEIRPGQSTNTLTIAKRGAEYAVHINRLHIRTISLSGFVPEKLWLSIDGDGTTVAFQKVQVRSFDSEPLAPPVAPGYLIYEDTFTDMDYRGWSGGQEVTQEPGRLALGVMDERSATLAMNSAIPSLTDFAYEMDLGWSGTRGSYGPYFVTADESAVFVELDPTGILSLTHCSKDSNCRALLDKGVAGIADGSGALNRFTALRKDKTMHVFLNTRFVGSVTLPNNPPLSAIGAKARGAAAKAFVDAARLYSFDPPQTAAPKRYAPLPDIRQDIPASYRVFVVWAFLSVAHTESAPLNTTALAKQVRREVVRALPPQTVQEIRQWYQSARMPIDTHFGQWNGFAIRLQGTGPFESPAAVEEPLRQVLPLFNRFWKEGKLAELWERMALPVYEARLAVEVALAQLAIADVLAYALAEPLSQEVVYVSNLVGPPAHGTSVPTGKKTALVIHAQPNESAWTSTVRHEYIHSIVEPWLKLLKARWAGKATLMSRVPQKVKDVPGYSTWSGFLGETLTQAIEIRVAALYDPFGGEAQRELVSRKDEFFLTPLFVDALKAVDAMGLRSDNFMERVLSAIP